MIVAVKSKRQFHCPPPADMSSQRLALIVPEPISSFSVTSRMTTGAPTASPAVDPPRESAQPTHVPSPRRTASENGSVCGKGGPPASTPPAAPATAVPLTTRVGAVEEGVVLVVDVAADVVSSDDGVVDDDVSSLVSETAASVVGAPGRWIGPASRLLEQAATSTAATPITIVRPRPTSPSFPGQSPRFSSNTLVDRQTVGHWRWR